MKITLEQLNKIRSALYLAGYFVNDASGGSQVEQWETDKDTLDTAWEIIKQIEAQQ